MNSSACSTAWRRRTGRVLRAGHQTRRFCAGGQSERVWWQRTRLSSDCCGSPLRSDHLRSWTQRTTRIPSRMAIAMAAISFGPSSLSYRGGAGSRLATPRGVRSATEFCKSSPLLPNTLGTEAAAVRPTNEQNPRELAREASFSCVASPFATGRGVGRASRLLRVRAGCIGHAVGNRVRRTARSWEGRGRVAGGGDSRAAPPSASTRLRARAARAAPVPSAMQTAHGFDMRHRQVARSSSWTSSRALVEREVHPVLLHVGLAGPCLVHPERLEGGPRRAACCGSRASCAVAPRRAN